MDTYDLPNTCLNFEEKNFWLRFIERVTPKKAKLNPEKEEDLAVVKCNMRLLKAWASETKLLPYWLIDCLDVDLNKSKCIINQLSNFSDFSWIHFFYRDILIYYKRISCQDN